MNPEDRKNWQGFLDLLQPPPGYRLHAALGTTFGLSIDALIAALLAMCDADGEELAGNPVAAVMAINRMSHKVRVLVHPATITGAAANVDTRSFVSLLDRLIVEVRRTEGLFHPKVWALRFERVGPARDGKPAQIGRVLVGSRNLTSSSSFEMGAAFEGAVPSEGVEASGLGADVARALREWLTATQVHYPQAIEDLPNFIERLAFDIPFEAKALLRLRWQGGARKPLADALPARLRRAVVVAPFIQPDFVAEALERTEMLQIVSIPESLDALPDESIAALDARAAAQGAPVLYQVTHHGNPDDSYIDGIHAKLLLAEDHRVQQVTFVGSANATGPGWGLKAPANVEAMLEMRPGMDIDRFIAGFILESKTRLHPWVSQYERSAKPEPDPEKEMERHILSALREVAKAELIAHYDKRLRRLRLSRTSRKSALPAWVTAQGLTFSFCPLLLSEKSEAWRAIGEIEGGCQFDDVPIEKLSAFVVLRAQSRTPPLESRRFIVAKLDIEDALIEERDHALRAGILASVDPAMVLNALVRGLAHVRSSAPGGRSHVPTLNRGLQALLADTTLERLLHAVALEPALVTEMQLLLGPLHGEPLLKLCDDLKTAIGRVYSEVAP